MVAPNVCEQLYGFQYRHTQRPWVQRKAHSIQGIQGQVKQMGHYTGAKARINRRLGSMIFESAGAIRASERRSDPPGVRQKRRNKPSTYGEGLIEKQKIKYYYGFGEKQLRRFFAKAARKTGNTGDIFLIECELRLDNVVRRSGFTKTRPQARQGIVHGHFTVNGIPVDKPSFQVKPGDIVDVRRKGKLVDLYQQAIATQTGEPCDWISSDNERLRFTVDRRPDRSDVSLPVDINKVVEFMSR